MRRRRAAEIAGGLAALLGLVGTARGGDNPPTHDCRIDGIAHTVRCGFVRRPLDPARPGAPTIDVQYVVVPALARRKRPDPVFLLAGGPGQSAIDLAGQTLPLFARLNNRRDIVYVDQRGTGRSAPLACDERPDESLADSADPRHPLERLATCRAALEKLPYIRSDADLGAFTTTLAMQDLDAVRQALGAGRIDLVGVSYGTRAALEYMRQFPAAVRRSVLDAVAPPDMALPASFSTDGQAALDALFDACAADADCRSRHPSLRAGWRALLASLPKPVTAVHPLTGAPERFTLTRPMVLSAVRAPLYSPSIAAALPEAIDAAVHGRYEPLLGVGAMPGARAGARLATGMHFSVVCAEDMPLLEGTATARDTDPPGTDFGRADADLYRSACASWPRGRVPAAFYTVPPSRTPTLLLSGGLDPATPPRHAARVARALGPAAQSVVVPNAGHGVLGIGCVRDVVFRFIDQGDDAAAPPVDARCIEAIPRPPAFVPIGAGAPP